jgi:SAM-dependent methyltransferase
LIKKTVKRILPVGVRNVVLNYSRNSKRRKLNKTYAGIGVVCPICKSQYKLFAPYGFKQRENALCPNCSTAERHRLLWKYCKEKTILLEDKNIKLLHFAPEKALYSLFSNRNNIEYYPVDLYPEIYNYDGIVKVEKVDITRIPFEDNYFDAIICYHVLQHVSNDKLAMSELFRVLNKEVGWGIIQVPIDYSREKTFEDFSITNSKEKAKAFGQPNHVRLYGRDYKDRLASVGFKVFEDDYINTFSDDEIFKSGFMKGELIYKCTK